MKNKIITVYGDLKHHHLTKEIKDYLVKNGFIVFYYDFYDLNYCEKLTDTEIKSVAEVFEAKISLSDYFLSVNFNGSRSKRSNDMINKAWGFKKPIIYFHENCNDDIKQIIPYIQATYNLEKSNEEISVSASKEDELYKKMICDTIKKGIEEIDEIKDMIYSLKKYIEKRMD